MSRIGTVAIAAAMSLAMSPTALAQEEQRVPRLDVEGHVMVSAGGEYVTARDGQDVVGGQSLMVADDSVAIVTYPDDCQITYEDPGTYVIPDDEDCRAIVAAHGPAGAGYGAGAAGVASGGWVAAGIVAGVVAATAAGIKGNLGKSDPAPPFPPPPPPPISP